MDMPEKGWPTGKFWRTNCSHPKHPGFPLQTLALVWNSFELIWSENASGPNEGLESVSLVTPVTLLNDPIAVDISPDDDSATKSVPLPTVAGLGRVAGPYESGGAVVHGTSSHSVLGYKAWKHPCFGMGVRTMDRCQISWLPDCPAGGCVVTCAPQGLALAISIKLAAMNEKYERLSIDFRL
jgi:hypothetical protein